MQLVFYLTTFSTLCMSYLLYLMFRCDRRCDGCDGKFGNLVGTKHTPRLNTFSPSAAAAGRKCLGMGSASVTCQIHYWRRAGKQFSLPTRCKPEPPPDDSGSGTAYSYHSGTGK